MDDRGSRWDIGPRAPVWRFVACVIVCAAKPAFLLEMLGPTRIVRRRTLVPYVLNRGLHGALQPEIWVGAIKQRTISRVKMRPVAVQTGAAGRPVVHHVGCDAMIQHEPAEHKVRLFNARIATTRS